MVFMPDSKDVMAQEYKVKSLAKAMHVLECFSNREPELGISDIARMLNLQKSTVHNIVSTFEEMGYMGQNKENGKYYLDVKLLQFCYIINNHLGYRKFFLPYMRKISQEMREVVYLGIPHDNEVLYIECCYPQDNNGGRNILGERAPMHCTSLGKVMLAYAPKEEQEAYAAQPMESFTSTTITTREQLLQELEEVRRQGYSVDRMEHEFGICCVGVPVFGNDGRVIAAVSISGPSLRFDQEMIQRNSARMQEILISAQRKL